MFHLFNSSINIYIFILAFQLNFFNYLQDMPLTTFPIYFIIRKRFCLQRLYRISIDNYAQFIFIVSYHFILYAHFINID